MTKFKLITLYDSSERELPAISEMLTQIELIQRRAITVSPEDSFEVHYIEVEGNYNRSALNSSEDERLILVLLFTPEFVLNERIVDDVRLVLLQQKETSIVVPVYCRPISSDGDLPWSTLIWAGQPRQSQARPRALSEYPANELDTATMDAAIYLKRAIRKCIDTAPRR